MFLITESNFNIKTDKKEKQIFLEGIFASAEKKNQNGRVYPKSILNREIEKIMEKVKDHTCIGELSHPTERAEPALERAAILVEDISWKEDDVYGKARVLSTPMGQIARNLIEDGVKYGISTRGLGTVNEETNMVNDDYQLLTWDLVSNPSNHGSWVNGIYEGKEFSLPKEKGPSKEEIQEALEYHAKKVFQVLENLR